MSDLCFSENPFLDIGRIVSLGARGERKTASLICFRAGADGQAPLVERRYDGTSKRWLNDGSKRI